MADLTINAGDVPTAAQFNSYMTHTGGAWNSWTPVVVQGVTPTITINSATYHRAGRNITFQAVITVTSAGTAANTVTITLPVTTASNGSLGVLIGGGAIVDASFGDYAGPLYTGSSGSGSTTLCSIGVGGSIATVGARLGSSSFTAALANTDVIRIWGSYEAASG